MEGMQKKYGKIRVSNLSRESTIIGRIGLAWDFDNVNNQYLNIFFIANKLMMIYFSMGLRTAGVPLIVRTRGHRLEVGIKFSNGRIINFKRYLHFDTAI